MPLYSIVINSPVYRGKNWQAVFAKNAKDAKQRLANYLWREYGEDQKIISKMSARKVMP